MANADPRDCRRGSPFSCLEAEAQIQSAVLTVLLAEHPVQLTISELARELVEDPDDFRQRDAVKQAVRDLTGVGLLHCHGIFVLPTRAALYFERLDVVI